ncbi:MAG: hypothetical protein H7203_16355 [Rhizobacter sp.]|nr:hypothetical protein [Burkholderiales bacterium]
MKRTLIAPLFLSIAIASTSGWVQAQTTGATTAAAAEMKMSRDQFLSMYKWDTVNDMWVMNDGMKMPEGIKSRAEVKAERDLYMSMHKYDLRSDKWVPMTTPRDMNTMSREEVKAETVNFLRTHRYDESTSKWMSRSSGGSQ